MITINLFSLLFLLQESSLIANEIASSQMRDLEKSAFGVMRTPGPDKDHVCLMFSTSMFVLNLTRHVYTDIKKIQIFFAHSIDMHY